jgi:AcrR family transcriptional regulator
MTQEDGIAPGGSTSTGSDEPGRSRGGRPRGSTRERILDIALALFNENGYDKTSLREIAERLGTTKAALYYHFERKEDILLALHLRLHDLGKGMFDRMGDLANTSQTAELWPELLNHFIDQLLSNREIFILHERNRNAFETLERSERHQEAHDDLEGQMRRFLASTTIPLSQRVRMACSIGGVLSTLIGPGEAFNDVPTGQLAQLLREAMHDLLQPAATTEPTVSESTE